MTLGERGLRPGPGLSEFLAPLRGRPYQRRGGPLTEDQIVQWARTHQQAERAWPHRVTESDVLPPGETWHKIDAALIHGYRGLRGGSSLARLLAQRCGARNRRDPPRLVIKTILHWADEFYARTGDWPSANSGSIVEAPGENWWSVNRALRDGERGLSGGSSLVDLLAKHRGRAYKRKGLPLSIPDIVTWAQAHHELTGELPTKSSGPVRGVPGENWAAIDASLRAGARNLRGQSSLARLLENHFEPSFSRAGEPLTVEKIASWAKAFRKRAGCWPTAQKALVHPRLRANQSDRGERWATIDLALREGHRGLRGGSSLARLLAEKVGVRRGHHARGA